MEAKAQAQSIQTKALKFILRSTSKRLKKNFKKLDLNTKLKLIVTPKKG